MNLTKSYSMRTMFKSCPRKVYFRYVAGVKIKEDWSKARYIGQEFHKALETLRKTFDLSETYKSLESSLSMCPYSNFNSEMEYVKLNAYLTGYYLRFNKDFRDASKIKTEVKLTKDDEICIVDAMIEHDDGSIDIIEDKTTSIFQDNMDSALLINDQLMNYVDFMEHKRITINNIYYRETLKSVHKQVKGESISAFRSRLQNLYISDNQSRYREFIIQPRLDEMTSFLSDRDITNSMIDDYIESFPRYVEWPKNTSSCIGKYGPCDYLGICTGRCDLSDHFEANEKDPIDNGEFRTRYLNINNEI